MNKKIVLYISPNGYLGGAERVVLTLAQAHLCHENYLPIILFFSPGEAVLSAQKMGIKTLVLKTSFRLSNPWRLVKAMFEIRSLVTHVKPDIIHSTMAYSHLVISAACLGKKIKTIWFQHGPVGKTLDKLASLFPVDSLFFNSQFLKQEHDKSYPKVHIRKSEHIIPLGISISDHERANPVFTNNLIIFGSAGRICSGKAFELIIRSLGELKKEDKLIDFKLLIAGDSKNAKDQAYSDHLKNLVGHYFLENHITFLGHIEDMGSFYRSIDLFIHATIEPEPFGLVIAEAMTCECLVLASDSGGSGELIDYGKNGFSYNCTDLINAKENLKKEILHILSIKQDQLRLNAKSGRQFITENYSVTKMLKAVEDIYNHL